MLIFGVMAAAQRACSIPTSSAFTMPVDEGSVTFDMAARVLPGRLEQALSENSIRILEDAIEASERTYLIFPEREPPLVKSLTAKARKMLQLLQSEVRDAVRNFIEEVGTPSNSELQNLKLVKLRAQGLDRRWVHFSGEC